jgi:hypothetical protein
MTIERQHQILLKQLHELHEELETWRLSNHQGKESPDVPFYRLAATDAKRRLEDMKRRLEAQGDFKNENAALLFRLHETQEKLEQALWEKHHAQPGIAPSGAPSGGVRAELRDAHKDATHRHLHFSIKQMDLADGGCWDAEVRLASHYGRPGLVIFKGGEGSDLPFANWPDAGKENSQSFVRLFPDETGAARLLRASKASGLLAIEESLAAMEEALRSDEQFQISRTLQPPDVEFWLLMLQRVRSGLKKIPKLFRYDDVRGKAMPDGALKVTVVNALHEGRPLDRFAIVWPEAASSGGAAPRFIFLNAEGNLPLFESWPLDEQGYPLREWSLDLGNSAGAVFGQMTSSDRDLLGRILDEIPNFLHHHNAQNSSQPVDKVRLTSTIKRVRLRWRGLAMLASLPLTKFGKS